MGVKEGGRVGTNSTRPNGLWQNLPYTVSSLKIRLAKIGLKGGLPVVMYFIQQFRFCYPWCHFVRVGIEPRTVAEIALTFKTVDYLQNYHYPSTVPMISWLSQSHNHNEQYGTLLNFSHIQYYSGLAEFYPRGYSICSSTPIPEVNTSYWYSSYPAPQYSDHQTSAGFSGPVDYHQFR